MNQIKLYEKLHKRLSEHALPYWCQGLVWRWRQKYFHILTITYFYLHAFENYKIRYIWKFGKKIYIRIFSSILYLICLFFFDDDNDCPELSCPREEKKGVQGDGEEKAEDWRKGSQTGTLTPGADAPTGLPRSGILDARIRRKHGWWYRGLIHRKGRKG